MLWPSYLFLSGSALKLLTQPSFSLDHHPHQQAHSFLCWGRLETPKRGMNNSCISHYTYIPRDSSTIVIPEGLQITILAGFSGLRTDVRRLLGWGEWDEVQQGQVPGSALWFEAVPHMNDTVWEENSLGAALLKSNWVFWWTKSWMWAISVLLQPGRPTISWAASKEGWPGGRGRWLSLFTLLKPHLEYASKPGDPSMGGMQSCWRRSRGGLWRQSDGWNTSPMKKVWGYSGWRREGSRETSLQLSSALRELLNRRRITYYTVW